MKRVVIAAVLLSALVIGANIARWEFAVAQPPTEPMPTYVLMDATRMSSGVLYTDSPRLVSRTLDVSRTAGWAGADVFVSADMEAGAVLTATVELSADRENWSSVVYETTGQDGDGTTIIVPMPPLTRVLSPNVDGHDTEYFLIVLAGQYIRTRLEASGVVTPTVTVTYRDYPQWP